MKPAESDDEACLGVADNGAAHWAGFVDDQKLREVDEARQYSALFPIVSNVMATIRPDGNSLARK